MHAMPSPRPIHPMPSFVFPFTLTSSTRDAERRRESRSHQLAMRRDLRTFGDDGDVDLLHAPAHVRDPHDRGVQHLDRVSAFVGRIAIGKHLADVARGRRAENRVGERVRRRRRRRSVPRDARRWEWERRRGSAVPAARSDASRSRCLRGMRDAGRGTRDRRRSSRGASPRWFAAPHPVPRPLPGDRSNSPAAAARP